MLLHLVDALDVFGRDDTEGIAAADDRAVATLNALYRLEHRYSTGEHPLLECDRLRDVTAAAAERASGDLGAAARELETVHRFYR